jgi:hypothetical protein
MKLSEINSGKWIVSKDLEIINSGSSSKIEQELHINLLAVGDESDKEEMHICCNIQKWITKLAANPSFYLNNIGISLKEPKENSLVVSCMGVMYNSRFLTIRNKKVEQKVLSKEKKTILIKRFKDARIARMKDILLKTGD